VSSPVKALLSLLLAAAWLLSACQASGEPPGGPAAASPTPTQTRTPAGSPTPRPARTSTPTPRPAIRADPQRASLVFWHAWPAEQFAPLLAQFNAENPWRITVTAQSFPSADRLGQALVEAAGSAAAPQAAAAYPDQALDWQGQELLAALTAYLDDPQWGLSAAEQADFYPRFWQAGQAGGLRYALPALRSGQFLFYNRTWARELGFNLAPTTTEALRTQACAANQAMRQDRTTANDATGGWLVSDQALTVLGWIYAFGGGALDPQASGYRFDTPAARQAFEFLKSLYDANCAWVSLDPYPDEALAGRRALLATGSPVDIPFQTQAIAEAGSGDQWSVLPFPAPAGKPVVPLSGPSLVVLKGEERQQLAAWLFLRWLVSPEAQAAWVRLSGDLPVRAAALDGLKDYQATHPQWGEALRLATTYGAGEPALASWGAVQWAVHDAGTQLFRSYFTADRIPATLEELERTAAELHARFMEK
jgi:ABC-type glycerol-3-phosphate transport system substrate-binding protein